MKKGDGALLFQRRKTKEHVVMKNEIIYIYSRVYSGRLNDSIC